MRFSNFFDKLIVEIVKALNSGHNVQSKIPFILQNDGNKGNKMINSAQSLSDTEKKNTFVYSDIDSNCVTQSSLFEFFTKV